MTVSFSAGPQALGFFYQVRVALLLVLEGPDEVEATIEGLDDIQLDSVGTDVVKQKLFQVKHHITRKANLTDSSIDLWKTVRIWATYASKPNYPLTDSKLFLLTTATAQPGSIVHMLLANNRDPVEAEKRLLAIATTSSNKDLVTAFEAFSGLDSDARSALVSSIYVLDGQPNIHECKQKIKARIRPAVKREYLDSFYERVEGWWFDRAMQNLLEPGKKSRIQAFDVNEKMASIASGFHDESLPIDFLHESPDAEFVQTSKQKTFVKQLKAIGVEPRTVTKAIFDYYKAFCQRSRWLVDGLVVSGELENFESTLVDEWERCVDALKSENMGVTEEDLKSFGRHVFRWAELETGHLKIRPRVETDYVRRGSFHLLADKAPIPMIYWHPNFLGLLEAAVAAAGGDDK